VTIIERDLDPKKDNHPQNTGIILNIIRMMITSDVIDQGQEIEVMVKNIPEIKIKFTEKRISMKKMRMKLDMIGEIDLEKESLWVIQKRKVIELESRLTNALKENITSVRNSKNNRKR
jgi:hypothetical protein